MITRLDRHMGDIVSGRPVDESTENATIEANEEDLPLFSRVLCSNAFPIDV